MTHAFVFVRLARVARWKSNKGKTLPAFGSRVLVINFLCADESDPIMKLKANFSLNRSCAAHSTKVSCATMRGISAVEFFYMKSRGKTFFRERSEEFESN